jgi:hypothetical protein
MNREQPGGRAGDGVTMPSDVPTGLSVFDRFATRVRAPSIFVLPDVDTWQLIINTATTIVTFLLVALLQNTQNGPTRRSSTS